MSTTAIKERPILFSGPMVRALRARRKTQTRRAVVPQPGVGAKGCYHRPDGNFIWLTGPVGVGIGCSDPFACPYGCPGERLWVRENFLYRAGKTAVIYQADIDPAEAAGVGAMYGGWKPSIHLPRKFCRTVLELTDVRLQPLQQISEADAISEGLEVQMGDGTGRGPGFKWNGPGYWGGNRQERGYKTYHVRFPWKPQCSCKVGLPSAPVCAFAELWDHLNGPRGYSWDSNPWVWAITFKVLESPDA